MGPPVHVALISPGEMETEEAFVKEVTKSRGKKTTNKTVIFPTALACFSQFRTDQQMRIYAKHCSGRTGNIP